MLWQPFVVPDGAPGAADPGEGPLHDPAAAQHDEGMGGGAPDDLHSQPQVCVRPGDQLAGVAAIGPGQGHGAEAGAQPPRQRPGAVAVLDGRRGDTETSSSPAVFTAI